MERFVIIRSVIVPQSAEGEEAATRELIEKLRARE